MKYRIFYKDNKEPEPADSHVVTQDGLVAFWDEGAGWDIEPDQQDFRIELIKEEE